MERSGQILEWNVLELEWIEAVDGLDMEKRKKETKGDDWDSNMNGGCIQRENESTRRTS